MKSTISLFLALTAATFVSACTSVKTDPRSGYDSRRSMYLNTDRGGSHSSGRSVRQVDIEEPQPAPIRVKPGSQPPQYLNTSDSAPSPYESTRGSATSPLRHDAPDQSLYSR